MNKLLRSMRIVALPALLLAACVANATDINGAGASFPAPAYEKWAAHYKPRSEFSLNYQAMGSGAGIKQIVARIVDFGASDAPMTPADLTSNGLVQFPTLIGGIVPVVNLPGIAPGQLKLRGEVLADIFLGKISNWNDSRIASDNKGLKLPDLPIAVVYRADQSGSAFVFSSYLAQVSADWRRDVGAGTAVRWPVGVGGKGNEGSASYVKRLQGSIGFVEYAAAMQGKMAYVQLKNRDGQFVSPSDATLKAAANHAAWDVATGMGELLVNEPGPDSWPVTATTFVLLQKVQVDAERGKAVLAFFDWGLHDGASEAAALGYVPLPDAVVQKVREVWKAQVKDATGKALW